MHVHENSFSVVVVVVVVFNEVTWSKVFVTCVSTRYMVSWSDMAEDRQYRYEVIERKITATTTTSMESVMKIEDIDTRLRIMYVSIRFELTIGEGTSLRLPFGFLLKW